MSHERHSIVRTLKAVSNLLAIAVASPAALLCWFEERLHPGGEAVFWFWTHVVAVLPGLPGLYLRRAFYSMTLRRCSLNCWIDFGVLFAHRTAQVEDEVYIGAYSAIGSARLKKGCMIGTRANLLSGSAQHELRPDGRWGSTDATRLQEIEIGENSWVGEAAIVMADIGKGAQVGAGAVVSVAVPPGVVVAGNPARFVRSTQPNGADLASASAPSESPTVSNYAAFVDWLKCLGILLIAYGHLAGWAPFAALPPIYSKQIGVALFLFVTGYTLNRDSRGRWHVAFNRLFEVFVFGIGLALIVSTLTYVTQGRLQLSNYAPFVGGVNVLFDHFPANPTTWYLGTYLHVVLLWAVIGRRIRVSGFLLIGSFAVEVAVRALLIETAGSFVAYMTLPNWLTVFLLGSWYGQRANVSPLRMSDHAALGAGVALAAALLVWTMVAQRVPFEGNFPFMRLAGQDAMTGALLISVMVSAVYLAMTWLTFLAVTPLPAPRMVRFVARNTLVIFLAHMPVFYLLYPVLTGWGASRLATSAILMVVCVPGLAWLSEVIHRTGWPRSSRDRVFGHLDRTPGGATIATS